MKTSINWTRRIALWALVPLLIGAPTSTQARVETNVVYGMCSGAALLMDVHYPNQPNGHGIVFIAGSGWSAPLAYSAAPLKESSQVALYLPSLLQAGYTVFALTHRAAPTFRFPAPLEDVQRGVRFIRHNAARFHTDPASIGGFGGSSGGHLVSMLGTMDGAGDPNDEDPVNRESAKLQCIVARAAPVDLLRMSPSDSIDALALFLGSRVIKSTLKTSAEYKTAWTASPINHVSGHAAPFLLIHGDADLSVPFHQSVAMEAALKKAGVAVKLIRIEGGGHGPTFLGAKNPPDYQAEMVKWFDTYLRNKS